MKIRSVVLAAGLIGFSAVASASSFVWHDQRDRLHPGQYG